ncbi:MAG: CBS domain-containing protein [Candidatus Omnitrophica bacterium]|nr:CBS domain-containing protein [Candidatus Omnitrophota bacterium]
MQIRELMTADPEACLATDSCAVAVGIMRRRNCGFVPVVESHATGRVIGVVTDRDIALHFEKVNRPASGVFVADCMARDVKTIAPDAGLHEAAKLMEQFAIHRLPVVQNGRLVGVLSLKDIAVAADKRWAYPGSDTAEQKLGKIVEAIASARS